MGSRFESSKRTTALLRSPDAAALLLVSGVAALFAWRYVDFRLPPEEDAAMLLRYARNFAGGHGIVWNVGEAPVDGATDFLLVVLIGLLHRAGASLEHAALGLTLGAHLATVALVYLGMRRLQQAGMFASAASALLVALGPGAVIASSYFGATVFAFALSAAWLLGQRLVLRERRRWRDCTAFAGVALIATLIRPEGALMAAFMSAGLALALPAADALRLLASVAAVFLPFGGAFLAWRWHYFGYPLPNPFYKKGGWRLHGDGLRSSWSNLLRLCTPFLPAYALGLLSPQWRLALAFAIPLAGFTAIWVLLSEVMNFAARFQYPLLPIAALSWYPLVRALPRDIGLSRLRQRHELLRYATAFACLVTVEVLLARRFEDSLGIVRMPQGNYEMGLLLRPYAERGHTLATTEAGLLPLYSQWRALDTWGLNDAWITHHGSLTEAYLRQQRPAVIMWHEYFSPQAPPAPGRAGPWVDMVRTLHRYAEDHGFVLAAVFGRRPGDTHYYWVDADLPECAEIVGRMRSLAYPWPTDGRPAVDFAASARTSSPSCRAARSQGGEGGGLRLRDPTAAPG